MPEKLIHRGFSLPSNFSLILSFTVLPWCSPRLVNWSVTHYRLLVWLDEKVTQQFQICIMCPHGYSLVLSSSYLQAQITQGNETSCLQHAVFQFVSSNETSQLLTVVTIMQGSQQLQMRWWRHPFTACLRTWQEKHWLVPFSVYITPAIALWLRLRWFLPRSLQSRQLLLLHLLQLKDLHPQSSSSLQPQIVIYQCCFAVGMPREIPGALKLSFF